MSLLKSLWVWFTAPSRSEEQMWKRMDAAVAREQSRRVAAVAKFETLYREWKHAETLGGEAETNAFLALCSHRRAHQDIYFGEGSWGKR